MIWCFDQDDLDAALRGWSNGLVRVGVEPQHAEAYAKSIGEFFRSEQAAKLRVRERDVEVSARRQAI